MPPDPAAPDTPLAAPGGPSGVGAHHAVGDTAWAPRPTWTGDDPARPTAPGDRESPTFGVLAGGVWLVYLWPAAAQVLGGDWPLWQRLVGGVLLLAFLGLYVTTLAVMIPARRARNARQQGLEPFGPAPGDREMWLRVGGLVTIGLTSSAAFGGEWLTTMAFVAAVLAVWTDVPWPPRLIVATALVCEALLLVRGTGGDGDTASYFWLGFAVLVAGFVSYAARRRGELEGELRRAREQNARLAVSDERDRIARDLHDLLGHSLTVIAVKSQLAERLLDRGESERASTEIRDVRGVARDALREVRQVVDGFRGRPLSAELASCAAALRSADVEVRTEAPARGVPQDVEDVVAYVVREGTTNVLRHSAASRCTLAVRAEDGLVVATVADDGPRSVAARQIPGDPAAPRTADGGGNGLRGLAERVATVGGTLDVGPGPDGGTVLRATIAVPG
ncbi:sensor histidine kinase [Patulibacter sp.]|uniref:sensor histidine kinase n=1 Tax=Patulibacter sp. TaxID=1912859 RepID=UPI00272334A7|nr:sensor histidine kinase [Patulibacter sp.]MDO9409196.1 sensor histidine kinase [Patulibacter sp.]